jgi:hypothetical protein
MKRRHSGKQLGENDVVKAAGEVMQADAVQVGR